jgi:hypothetical protein
LNSAASWLLEPFAATASGAWLYGDDLTKIMPTISN